MRKKLKLKVSPAVKRMALKLGALFTDDRNRKMAVYTWDVDFCLLSLHSADTASTMRAVLASGVIGMLAMTGQRWCSLLDDPTRRKALDKAVAEGDVDRSLEFRGLTWGKVWWRHG